MFTRSPDLYDALYRFKDYEGETRQLRELIRGHNPSAATLLDVACGTGNHLHFLRQHYRVEGLDRNEALLEGARRRCPDVTFHNGDMRSFSLPGRFDVVTCLFSAIGYLKDTEGLGQAIGTMARHLHDHGILIIEPWFTPDQYWTNQLRVNIVDHAKYKGAWMYVPQRIGRTSVEDIYYLIGSSDGIDSFTERHEVTLFTREEMMSAFTAAGLDVRHDPVGLRGRGLYVGVQGSGTQ